jgi:hypothetical protein
VWRWNRFSARAVGLFEHIASSPLTGVDEAAGWAWIEALVVATPKGSRTLEHVAATFQALGPAPPAERSAVHVLNPDDPNLEHLIRLLRSEPSGGHLRALRAFEDELGADGVTAVLERLIADGLPAGRDPYAVVREQLRSACQQRRATAQAERAVFGAGGRPIEPEPDQYETKIRRPAPAQEEAHG